MRAVLAVIVVAVMGSLVWPPGVSRACAGLEPLATIPTGAGPREIVADGQRQRIYVANSADTTLSVIDTSTLSVVDVWPLNGPVRTMALNPTNGALYIAYAVDGGRTEVWMIDPASGQHVRGLWFPWSVNSVAVNVSLRRVYLAGRWTSPSAISWERLSVVDSDVMEELHTAHATSPNGTPLTEYSGVAVDEATGAVYAAHHYKYNQSSYIVAFDQDLRSTGGGIRFDDSTSSPESVVIDSTRRRALITIFGGLVLVDIGDAPRWQTRGTDPPLKYDGARVTIRGRFSVALDEAAGVAYAVPLNGLGGGPSAVSAIDVATAREVALAPLTGGTLYRLAVDSFAHRVYVTNENSGKVSSFRGFVSSDSPAC